MCLSFFGYDLSLLKSFSLRLPFLCLLNSLRAFMQVVTLTADTDPVLSLSTSPDCRHFTLFFTAPFAFYLLSLLYVILRYWIRECFSLPVTMLNLNSVRSLQILECILALHLQHGSEHCSRPKSGEAASALRDQTNIFKHTYCA